MRVNNLKNKVISIIGNIMFWVLIVTILISAFLFANSDSKEKSIFGYRYYNVITPSMTPTISVGSAVFVKMVDPQTLKESDVIAFRNEEDKVTTHRIIEIVKENGQTLFRTKGDNNSVEDANLVKTEDVEGVYFSRIAKVGNFLMFMQQPIGLAVLLLIILVVGLICLHIMNKIESKNISEEDKKYMKEFEEFKRKQQEQKDTQI